jgi:hypothetical protein
MPVPQVRELEARALQALIVRRDNMHTDTVPLTTESVPANERQVGGTHYKTEGGEQHWDMMWRLYREAWFVGGVTKYVLRYRKKDGLKDLRKARHYLDKLIELEEAVLTEQAQSIKEQCDEVRAKLGQPTPNPVFQDGHGFGHATPEYEEVEETSVCTIPPPGWKCTRPSGHDGPCAAVPEDQRVAGAERQPGTHPRCYFCTALTETLVETVKGPMCPQCYSSHVSSGTFKHHESGKE